MHFVRRLSYLLVTVAMLFVVTGCAVLPVPSFLVMLTPDFPSMKGRCTGAVIEARVVLTAAHCVSSVSRVVTGYGQEAYIIGARISDEHDVAILYTDRPLFVREYATLGNPDMGVAAALWGTCPYFMPHHARPAAYNGLMDIELVDGGSLAFGQWWMLPATGDVPGKACGGDSGGFILSQGKVVGVLSMVESDSYFFAIGSIAYTVPASYVLEWLESGE
jgi:hypothetical protein